MYKLVGIAALVGLVVAIKMLPWWGSVALIGAVLVVGKISAQRAFRGIFMGAFKAKSKVLEGATARIQSVSPAEAWKPEDLDDYDPDDEMEQQNHWSYIDAMIEVPQRAQTSGEPECDGFQHWDPGELMVVPVDATPGMEGLEEEDDVAEVYNVELYKDGHWVTLEDKVMGSQRVRLHVGSAEPLSGFKLRYYFEVL